MRSISAKPLPCPFCAERSTTTVADDVDCYYIRCDECFAEGPPEETLQEALSAWNYRAIGAPDRTLIAEAATNPARFAGPQAARSQGEWIADAIRVQLTSK